MEYLQLLLILQHVAVGGTALAGVSYLFFEDAFAKCFTPELAKWQLHTTLLLVTASFAISYAVDDLAKELIDRTPGMFCIGRTPVDAELGRIFLQPFFKTDQEERFSAVFPQRNDNHFHVTPLALEVIQVLKQQEQKVTTAGVARNSAVLDDSSHVEDPMLDALLSELPKELDGAPRSLGVLMHSHNKRDDQVQFSDATVASTAVNHIFYQAHDLISRYPTYADETNRFYQRPRFLRSLGFLSELFFLTYGILALLSHEQDPKWTILLALTGAAFVYGLFRNDAIVLSLPSWPFLCSFVFFVAFGVIRYLLWALGLLVKHQKSERGNSLAAIAIASFFGIILCSIGAHAESVELNQRVFGYFVSLYQHPEKTEFK